MNNAIFIIGEIGSGKSSSIRTLNPEETFIINMSNKPLPFRGFRKKYFEKKMDENGKEVIGNYIHTDNKDTVISILHSIDKKRPHIKTIVIDDFQYSMSNEFFRRISEKGFDKFNYIGYIAWSILKEVELLRDDLDVFILSHSELKDDGNVRLKTIGRLVDEKFSPDGTVSCIFHAIVEEGSYRFLTQKRGNLVAKTPMGMFDELVIDNDLFYVKQKIQTYLNEDIPY